MNTQSTQLLLATITLRNYSEVIMLALLKGLSTKTYLIVIVVLLTFGVFFYKAYTGGLVEKGELKSENVVLEHNVVHAEQSAKITDQVVSTYVEDSKKSHQTTETLRKEALNEYINKIEPPKPQAIVTQVAQPDGADRVTVLAKRLHENYCRARPSDARCFTDNANN